MMCGSVRALPEAVAWLLMCLTATAAAAERPPVVRMTMESMAVRGRSGGPMSVRVRLEYNRPQILEGRLVLTFYDGFRTSGDLLLTQRIEGIVLHGTDRVFHVLIPPLPEAYNGSYEVEAWFETDSERIPLSSSRTYRDPPDPFTILSGSTGMRSLVLASVSGSPDSRFMTGPRRGLHRLLSPDMFVSRGQVRSGEVTWSPSMLSAEDLPQDPLFLCSFDVVLLCERALARSTSEQLEALLTWTKAGGSLCVVAEENGLAVRHVSFLQELLRDAPMDVLIGRDGRLMLPRESDIPAAYVELGRCVVLPASRSVESLTADQTRWIRDFLWRVRGVGLCPAAVPDKPQAAGPADSAAGVYDYELPGERPLMIAIYGPFLLMPEDVQMVPFPVIIGLLTAYVLAVGPLDYWLLGLFRARKYTWVMFPLVTAVFTLAIVQTARFYLSSNETGGECRITDIGRDGRPLRESVLELDFIGTSADVDQSVQSGMMSCQRSAFFASGLPSPRDVSVSGRFPQDYTFRRRLEQWVPDITRSLTFSPREISELLFRSGSEGEAAGPPDWSDAELVTTAGGRERLRRWLDEVFAGRVLSAGVYHGRDEYVLTGTPILSRIDDSAGRAIRMRWLTALSEGQRFTESLRRDCLRFMTGSACWGQRAGFRRWVGQVSPGGSASMEDVVVLDNQNPDQWLLAVLLETDSGYHLIRRLYCCPQTD